MDTDDLLDSLKRANAASDDLATVQQLVRAGETAAAQQLAVQTLHAAVSADPTTRGTALFARAWSLSQNNRRAAITVARDASRELARDHNLNAWNVLRWAADLAFEHGLLDEAIPAYEDLLTELRQPKYAEYKSWANEMLSHAAIRLGAANQRRGRITQAAQWLVAGTIATTRFAPIGDATRETRLRSIAEMWRAIGDVSLAQSAEHLIHHELEA